ncbi:MAG: Phage protein, partial [Clostridiales bacterium 38_11]
GTKMDVSTYLGTTLVDKQTVLPNTDNLVDNDYVVWKANVALTATAGLALTLGSNGDAVTGSEYQAALDGFEAYSFNTIGCLSTTGSIIDLVVQYTKRLRDEVGVKFQAVVYQTASDHEGVISVENAVTDAGGLESSLVYWVTGAEAGCAVNKSLTNKKYDGEFTVNTNFKQSELEAALLAGKFIFHKVGDDVRVLEDINTFITVTDEKSSDFSNNQTIRVIDQIANDIAALFNTKYLGNVPNDGAGRISLWNDIVSHHQQMQSIRAIEDFNPDLVTVEQGSTKKAVVVNDVVTPVNAMAQLYMTVVVQ